jgi:hypothetical protein
MPGDTARQNGRKGGRPKGSKSQQTINKEAQRELVRQLVGAELVPMVQAQIEHAKGTKFLVARDPKTGKFMPVTEKSQVPNAIEVWSHPPSTQAFTDLMNRALDKPAEQVQEIKLTGEVTVIERLQAARKRLADAKGRAS